MDYREIIKENIRNVLLKKAKLQKKKELEYYDWVITNLIADLRDYERGERWAREPQDKLWKRQRVHFRMPKSSEIDKIFQKLLKEFFENDNWI